MIYIGTLRMFGLPFILIACAVVAARLMNLSRASRSLCYALLGGLAGYALSPLTGTLVGSVPHIMIEPRYFVRPFVGCIAPSVLFLSYLTSFCGILFGFIAGGFIGVRSTFAS